MSATHTTFYKGSTIRIIFRDGSQLIAKFVGKLSDKLMRVQLENGKTRDVRIADMRSCGYYKPWMHERAK